MHRKYPIVLLVLFIASLGALITVGRYWGGGSITEPTFTERCLSDGNMWHTMTPLRQGEELPGESAPGCMTADGANHFSSYQEYKEAKNPGESNVTLEPITPNAGEEALLQFSARTLDGAVPELYREHERYLHVIIISRDMTVFAHVHPDDQVGFSRDAVERGEFQVPFVFPKAGEYLIAVDYAHKLKHESRQFRVIVQGEPLQSQEALVREPVALFGGLEVSFDYSSSFADHMNLLRFTVRKDGSDVLNMTPYLGAAMHVAIVKNDLSEFIHTHGEWHPPGYVAQPTLSHVHVPPPAQFGPAIEAHTVFPSPGLYTVFGELKHEGKVIPTSFSVRVE